MIGMSLYNAAEHGEYLEVASLLLNQNAHLDQIIKSQALCIASSKGHFLVVKCLLEQCREEISNDYKTLALWSASRTGSLPVVEYFYRHCPELSMDEKELALYPAAESGHTEIITFIMMHFGSQISPITKGLVLRYTKHSNHNDEALCAISRESATPIFAPSFTAVQRQEYSKECNPAVGARKASLG